MDKASYLTDHLTEYGHYEFDLVAQADSEVIESLVDKSSIHKTYAMVDIVLIGTALHQYFRYC